MPMFPAHAEGQCVAPGAGPSAGKHKPAKRGGPFAALRGVKGKD
jgi:hypothetical protein